MPRAGRAMRVSTTLLAQITAGGSGWRTIGKQQRSEFFKRTFVYIALKINDFAQRLPVFDPAPVVEFRLGVTVQTKIAFAAAHPQQKPALFLANAEWVGMATDKSSRQAVAQPARGAAEQFHLMLMQADFLGQFTIHRLFGGLIRLDTALRKLPRVLANTTPPEQSVLFVAKYDADIRPESVCIYHRCCGREARDEVIFPYSGI